MKKIFVTSDGKTLVTSDNKTLLSQEKEVSIMAKFQFKIVTGATEAACKSTYDSLVDSTTHLHDPYTFYLFDKGGVGYLGDTPLFGGDASKFNMVSANMVADDLKPEFEELKKQYKGIAKSDEDVLSIALFGDVAIKFIEQRNEDAIPTVIHVEA
jgi:hypothetical protein